jgi:quercetin dioxygenase-like cupin family protein
MEECKLLHNKPLAIGSSRGTIYDFDDPGDTLAEHSHDYADVHFSIIARGSFRVFGPDFEITANTGNIIDWDVGKSHGFEALEKNSRLINIIKYPT